MKRIAIAIALFIPAFAFAQGKAVVAVDQAEAIVTVTKVDPKARTVTVRGPKGNLQTLQVPKEAQNLDQVKPGSRFKVKYAEAAAIALTKGGKPSERMDKTVQLAPKGGNPGGVAVRTYEIAGVIDAIDYKNRYVAVRGPKGNTVALQVADTVKNFDQVTVGDQITVAFTQALAVEMIPHETAKPKAAAKKK